MFGSIFKLLLFVSLCGALFVLSVSAEEHAASTAPVSAPSAASPEKKFNLSDWRASTPVQQTPENSLWKMAKGLGLCLATFCLVIFALKRHRRFSGVTGTQRMRLIERMPLSSKNSLALVEVDGRSLLVSVSAESVTYLKEIRRRPKFESLVKKLQEAPVPPRAANAGGQ